MTEPPSDEPFSSAPGAAEVAAPVQQRRTASIVLCVVVVLALAGAGLATFLVLRGGSSTSSGTTGTSSAQPATDQVMSAVAGVPTATLNTVGLGHAVASPHPVEGTPLELNGKPELLFIGAEFCPYCAAERWSMAVALSRFGTLSGVTQTTSSSNDVDPDTATLDFVHASYSSPYLTLVAVENEDREHKLLEQTTAAQNALWDKYSTVGRSYPFLDFGNRYAEVGPTLDPKVLAGLTQAQIASRLANPADPVAASVDGAANILTAAICGTTNDQPATVCTSTEIANIEGQLDNLTSS